MKQIFGVLILGLLTAVALWYVTQGTSSHPSDGATSGERASVDRESEPGVPSVSAPLTISGKGSSTVAAPGPDEIQIFGNVRDSGSGNGIAGALIDHAELNLPPNKVFTDADGNYVCNLAVEALLISRILTCHAPPYATAYEPIDRDLLDDAGGRVEVNFDLVPGARVQGRVVLEGTAEGVVGLRVFAYPGTIDGQRLPTGGKFRVGETDADGRFQIDGLSPQRYNFQLIDPNDMYLDSSPVRSPLDMGKAQTYTAPDIVVALGARVDGVVTNEKGVPVSGARVEFDAPKAAGAVRWRRVLSDADGKFRVTGLDWNTVYRIEVQADGYATSRPENIMAITNYVTPYVPVVMKEGACVAGRVVYLDDSPASGLHVMLTRYDSKGAEERFGSKGSATKSNGEFEFGNVGPGRYEVKVGGPDVTSLETSRWQLTINEASISVENIALFVQRGSSIVIPVRDPIRGRVRTADRKPVPRARIRTTKAFYSEHGADSATTNERGEFELGVLGGGPVDIVVTSSKGHAFEENVPLNANVTIVVDDKLGISGTVLDPDGDPLSKCRTFVLPAFSFAASRPSLLDDMTWRSQHEASVTDTDGRFHLNPVLPGTYFVVSSCAGNLYGISDNFVVAEIADDTNIVVQTLRPGTIGGKVFSVKTKKPMPGVEVLARPVFENVPRMNNLSMAGGPFIGHGGVTDNNGVYTFSGLCPGTYIVTAHHPDHKLTGRKRVNLKEGAVLTKVNLRMKEND